MIGNFRSTFTALWVVSEAFLNLFFSFFCRFTFSLFTFFLSGLFSLYFQSESILQRVANSLKGVLAVL